MMSIKPLELQHRLQQERKLHLIDVRTPVEYAEVHVSDVPLVPLDALDAVTLANVNGFTKDQPLYIFCASGNRAKRAAEKLAKSGYEQCCVVEGGVKAWIEAGLPVDRAANRIISLERQVRIAAGSLVLAGVLLAYFINPSFIWLSGFVGGGLVFAGITDWCGMGMLLAKAPWNQCAKNSCCAKQAKFGCF